MPTLLLYQKTPKNNRAIIGGKYENRIITKKGKTYYRFKIRLGDKVTSRSGFKSSTAAIAASSDLKSNFESDTCGNVTYEEVYKEWLPIYAARVKVTTLKNTTVKFENHILPIFGKKE